MKKRLLWLMTCGICVCLLFYCNIHLEYIDNKARLDALSQKHKVQKEKEYVSWEERELKIHPDYKKLAIFVDINEKTLELMNLEKKEVLKKYVIASGKPSTPSPLGSFKIIGKNSNWGSGFGTRFMAINAPWGKYGIHGTDQPHSIGCASSHGCIRMRNKDVEELYSIVKVGTPVVIWGGVFGPFGNGFRILKPGDRGADVYEIQRYMKEKGYYPGWIDGVYGDGMKGCVLRFKKDHQLSTTHNVDYGFYKALGIELFE